MQNSCALDAVYTSLPSFAMLPCFVLGSGESVSRKSHNAPNTLTL